MSCIVCVCVCNAFFINNARYIRNYYICITRFRYFRLKLWLRKSYNIKHPHILCVILDVQFGSSPVSSLGVVANGVPGLHANPLRDRAVLLLLLAQDLLDFKRLLRWLCFLRRKSFRVSEK